jgi:site-specific recombinase
MAQSPNTAAQRLLDQFLAEPGTRMLAEIIAWLRDAQPGQLGFESPRTRRLAALHEAIEQHDRVERLRAKFREVWTHHSGVRLLAEVGLPVHTTLLKESTERMVDRLVPRLDPPDDLFVLVARLKLSDEDIAWVEGLSPDEIAPWREIVAIPLSSFAGAARLVAHRLAVAGVTRELLLLDPTEPDSDSPFLRLPAAVEALIQAPADDATRTAYAAVRADVDETGRRAHRNLDERGVSTDVLFTLELIEILLRRLDELVGAIEGKIDRRILAAELLRGSRSQRGVRSLAHNTVKRLALTVTEHTAETGEHYQARNAAEWDATGRSASGAGVLTAFTAVIKYLLAAAPFAPVVQGLGAALNYSLSFMAIQFAHYTLASKQPAMTGAALASALSDRDAVDRQVELVAGISRSQMAATIGNVFATVPVAVLIAAITNWATGTPLLDSAKALHSVHAVHPFLSLTIPYAMLTGVFLWASSLAAGWAKNWSAYRGLPEALARHRGLSAAFGPSVAARAGSFAANHLSGVVGYITLGILLGFVPVLVTSFLGIPLEVRHVTLQAASLALASASLYGGAAFVWGDVAWGALAIGLIALCNIGVSFALALHTAMRARDLGADERARLWRAIRAAFRAEPSRFLWRPRA